MGLDFGNLAGAAGGLASALTGEKSLKSFLNGINWFGIQVKNNFEITFAGFTDITFFATNVSIPGMHQNFTEIYYNGRKIDVPINCDYDHEFTITILNDALGYIYSAIVNFIMQDSINIKADSGYTMIIKAMNGDFKYPGTTYTLKGVRIESVDTLSYGYSDNDISTFNINCKCNRFTATPGALSKIADVVGAANSILG